MATSTLVNHMTAVRTSNGAVTNKSSLDKCLDLFFIAGASRRMSEDDIRLAFVNARAQDKLLAWRIVFWARDCRGGAGEKRFFRVIAKYAVKHLKEEWEHVAIAVPEVGSWKDLFLIDEPSDNVLNYLSHNLYNNSLLAKYFPRKGKWFTAMHKYKSMTPKEFRKFLVARTFVVEHDICNNKLENINYSAVPSVAMNRYKNLFQRKDGDRFNAYIQDVLDGKDKINASVLFPNDVIAPLLRHDHHLANLDTMQAQWDALPDYMEGSDERILPVCDVSGSMTGLPMEVSIALGIYISTRNVGPFQNAIMTFSENPEMHIIEGSNIYDQVNNLEKADWGMNTNLAATFQEILDHAVEYGVHEDDMPTKVLIISDMEFDRCGQNTNLDYIKHQYEANGYELPEIVFWNVNGRLNNLPGQKNDLGIGLVSGFSPAILKTILSGEIVDPIKLMRDTVDTKKYLDITEWM